LLLSRLLFLKRDIITTFDAPHGFSVIDDGPLYLAQMTHGHQTKPNSTLFAPQAETKSPSPSLIVHTVILGSAGSFKLTEPLERVVISTYNNIWRRESLGGIYQGLSVQSEPLLEMPQGNINPRRLIRYPWEKFIRQRLKPGILLQLIPPKYGYLEH